ncbi:hypothetical protein PTTG_01023 [Puccinia triticina 1-1 BBBD Race 1]|uniref:Uncharacterized protein n=1 Tax=Puccinia triticina (isolate 1-1 / race 1 (BBBD)) TaxID=630390 RepID=A0A180GV11_PUCT1|nr:hypothetical protein PTTG_01023 [Puccinia triticina 1-1 BBBD Race 1]
MASSSLARRIAGQVLLSRNQHHHYYSHQPQPNQQQPEPEQHELAQIETLAKGSSNNDRIFEILRSRHRSRKQTIALIDHLLSHTPLPAAGDIRHIASLAERIHQATSIEIFRDEAGLLAGKLFARTEPSFEHVWAWYELAKSRTAGPGLARCLVALLGFRAELAAHPARLAQLLADLDQLARTALSPADRLRAIENLLGIAIRARRPSLAARALADPLVEPLEGQLLMGEPTMVDLLGKLLLLAENRDQAFGFYEQLLRLGRPSPRFFERLLRDYLALCESPRAGEERPQALPIPRLMAILAHFRRAQIPIDSHTYAILLNHFSTVVRLNPRNLSTRLQLERIHTLIKLDIHLEPDPLLVHQLFKAFSYNGLYDKAWAIWDQFFFSPSSAFARRKSSASGGFSRISNPSFATMFDLAGFESERFGDGRLNRRALAGWAFLPKSPQPPASCYLNKNLFDAWLECLCRSRRVEQALLLVFPASPDVRALNSDDVDQPASEQQQQQQLLYPITKPFIDRRTLSILLRFSKREDQLGCSPALLPIVTQNIQACFPDLWGEVQDQGRFN